MTKAKQGDRVWCITASDDSAADGESDVRMPWYGQVIRARPNGASVSLSLAVLCGCDDYPPPADIVVDENFKWTATAYGSEVYATEREAWQAYAVAVECERIRYLGLAESRAADAAIAAERLKR